VKSSEAAKKLAADHELCVLQRIWWCWWPHVLSGRCVKDTSVSI